MTSWVLVFLFTFHDGRQVEATQDAVALEEYRPVRTLRGCQQGPMRVIYTDTHSSEDHDLRLVVYKSIETGKIWVLPYDMFMSKVDRHKYPDAVQKYRFEAVTAG